MNDYYENDSARYQDAIDAVRKTNRATISTVQRHLVIGYNRAARYIEQMEIDGIVSAQDLCGARTVLPVKA